MNFALLTKIAAIIAGAGLVATIVVAVVPAPVVDKGIWLDQPIADSQLQPGPAIVAMHASNGHLGQFRLVVRSNGSTVKVLNDTSVTVEKSSILFGELSSGAVEWNAQPGVYTLEPRYLAAGSWVKGDMVTVTVTSPDGALPVAGATSAPTATPTPLPTDTETAEPEAEPTPPAGGPSPTSTPTPVAAQMPTGYVQRSGTDGHTSTFSVHGVTPEFVDVDVQVRSRTSGAWSSWGSLGCSDLVSEGSGKYGCQVVNHVWGWSTSGRDAEVRVVITNYDDESLVYTSPTVAWRVMPDIG